LISSTISIIIFIENLIEYYFLIISNLITCLLTKIKIKIKIKGSHIQILIKDCHSTPRRGHLSPIKNKQSKDKRKSKYFIIGIFIKREKGFKTFSGKIVGFMSSSRPKNLNTTFHSKNSRGGTQFLVHNTTLPNTSNSQWGKDNLV
jgi:hypothetical protein